jgi:isoleucyl-tRNA synthetase
MYWMLSAMVRWLTPILSFTAEEMWRYMPGVRSESVLLERWAELPAGAGVGPSLDWNAVLNLRGVVTRQLEKLRGEAVIGGSVDAEVDVYCDAALHETLCAFGEELKFVFITSAARVHPSEERPDSAVAAEPTENNTTWIAVKASAHTKCERCWHKCADVGSHAAHPRLCGRCVRNVDGPDEVRRHS